VFTSAKHLLCLVCLFVFATPTVAAADWQEYRLAGFNSFDNGDYVRAAGQFERALAVAYEEHAPAREVGAILENLATAFLVAGEPRNAWRAIERWDQLLASSVGEPWTAEQMHVRDNLAPLIRDALAMPAASRGLQPRAEVATVSDDSNFAVHLESLKNQKGVQPSWAALQETYPSLLADKTLHVRRVDLGDKGIFYRILAAPFADPSEAQKVCRDLEAAGHYCAVLSLD
jgi:hypothetical protein